MSTNLISPRLVGLSEASRLLSVSIFTLRRRIHDGDIRVTNIGGRVLIPVAEIDRIAADGVGTRRGRKAKV